MTIADTTLTPKQLDILDAATRVFAHHGFRAGTVQLVAKEAGLSQAGLIHHFPTKEAILLAVLEHRDLGDRDVMGPALNEGVHVVETYRRVLTWNAARPDRMRFFAVLSAEALAADHPAHEYFQRRFAATAEVTTELVRRNQADGIVRADMPAETIADLVVAVAHGFRYAVLVAADVEHHRSILDALERLLTPPD